MTSAVYSADVEAAGNRRSDKVIGEEAVQQTSGLVWVRMTSPLAGDAALWHGVAPYMPDAVRQESLCGWEFVSLILEVSDPEGSVAETDVCVVCRHAAEAVTRR